MYVSGFTNSSGGTETAISWVNNGAATTLPIPPNDTAQGYAAEAIAVSGSNVYVSGSGVNGGGLGAAAYWLNGAATTLPLPSDISDSTASSWAAGIAVSGGDVYAVGSAGQTAVYWVNSGEGTLLSMPTGTAESSASAIAVATQ